MNKAEKFNSETIIPFDDSAVDGLIEEVRKLRPLLQENAADGEKQRSPMKVVADALHERGIFSMLIPKRWGGKGLSTTDFSRVQMEVAKGDPSISWVVQIINGQSWVATLGSDALQEALFSDGPALICGAYNPPGKAKKVDGGYIVNGAWPYSSGSRQANWVQGGCLITESDGPVVPGINMAYIPIDQVEIVDTWFVTGMQGTGSDTTVAKDVFVPDHMMVTMDKPFGTIEPGMKHVGAASDFLQVVPTVRTTGIAQLLGAAEYMLELAEAEAKAKPVVTTTFTTKTQSHVVVHDLGRVAAQLDAAKTLLFSLTKQLDEAALSGTKLTTDECAKQKAQCAQVTELIHAAIEKIMYISGSSAFTHKNPLQRYWRDVHVGLRHITNLPQIGYEIYGRNRLDVEPNISPAGAY